MLLLKYGSVIYMDPFSINLEACINLFALLTRKLRFLLWRQSLFFFFSLQPTSFDLSYLECLSMLDSHKAVEKRLTFLYFAQ